MAIANGLCDGGRATLQAHEGRLDRLETQQDRTADKLDSMDAKWSAKLNTLTGAVVILALTLAANLATRLLGG